MVFTTAYRILGNADDAEDALQEVFLKLTGAWDGPLGPDAVRDWGAYLRVMATRCAVSLLRVRSNRRRGTVPLGDNVAAPDRRDSKRLETSERMQLLRRALGGLKQRDAGVFALRHFEELSYEEIAAQMNLSVSQVGVILHRTRKRLQKLLDHARRGWSTSDRHEVREHLSELGERS